MPWQFEPKKDACLSAKSTISSPTNVISRWFPNGVTYPDVSQDFLSQDKKATRRTETSKYPEEKKSIEIP